MKILKIIHGYPPEYNAGSEVYTQSVCNELCKNHDVILFSREENEYEPDFCFRETLTESGIRHIRVNMARAKDGYNHPLLNERFGQLLLEIKPDVAHIGHLNHLSTGIVDKLYDRKIPILFTLHDFWLMCPRGQFLQRNFDGQNLFILCDGQGNSKCADQCYSMYYSGIDRSQLTGLATSSSQQSVSSTSNDQKHWTGWIEKRMLHIRAICSKIDLFHAPSKFLMNQFITDFQIPESKIFYLDYGFPTQYLQPVNPENKEFYTFGYIGTHTAAKGINMLIEAYNQLNGKVKLKIFGRTNGQNTAALKRLSVNSRNPVEFAGEYINQNLATKVFNHIDCIVVPSIWAENSPLVIHEAQACKIPVITSDFGGMKEYVEHQVNGLLFNHRDTASLTEQMQFAVDHPEHMRKLGQQGYLFSPGGNVPIIEDHCQELMKCYQKIIQNGK